MVYYERPVFVLFPILLLFWQVVAYCLKKKRRVSSLTDTLLTGIGAVGHAAAITLILLSDGTLSDVLLLVLASGALSLLLSPTPNKAADKTEEDDG